MRIPSENVAQLATSCSTQVDADTEVVGIDEGQFFDAELPAVCNTLADRGKRVIVAGLDQDYLGKPFEPMPQLLAIAEYITKTLRDLHGVRQPGQPHAAPRRQQRPRAASARSGIYEARCRHCFDPDARRDAEDADRSDADGRCGRRRCVEPLIDARVELARTLLQRSCCCSASGSWSPTLGWSLELRALPAPQRGALLDLAGAEAAASTASASALGVVLGLLLSRQAVRARVAPAGCSARR